MGARRILIKIAKLFYPLARPFIPVFRRYLTSYRNYKIAGIYHSGAVTIKDFCFVEKELKYKPLISVVVPVFNPVHHHFLEMVYSVVNQHYGNWELILVNASSDKGLRQAATDAVHIDTRIKILETNENKGISANTNLGIKQASGEYVALFDHDDLLHPCALHSVVEAMMGNDKADLLYTDEDKISSSGDRYFQPHYKPGWSPDLLRNVNYITHLAVIKRSLLSKLGGLRPVCDGAQDYDLMLRIADKSPVVKHVPKVLYHWRAAPGSTADLVSNKQYIIKAGVRALQDHLKRNNLKATAVSLVGKPGYYEVKYLPVSYSIIIGPVSPSKYEACSQWLGMLLDTIPQATKVELIIGDWFKNNSSQLNKENVKVKIVPPSNSYWRKAAKMVSKKAVICFRIAALPATDKALEKLAAAAAASPNTAVGAVIVNKTGTIYNSGIINAAGTAVKLFEGYQFGRNTFFGDTDWVRNVDDLTTNVVAFNSALFKKIMDESFTNFGRSASIRGMGGPLVNKLNYVVWAHSAFKYLGPLKLTLNNQYHRVQQLRFIPQPIIVVDNWGEKHERHES